MDAITLRAATDADAAFLQSVYASTRMEELAVTGWSDDQKQEFCLMQFRAQDSHYRAHFPNAEYHIIRSGNEDVGRLSIDPRNNAIHILDLALLPDHRNKGIGSSLLRKYQAEAGAGGHAVSIYVEKFNPALRLYERMGFRPVQEEGVHLLMKWEPS
jgi:ribosomal protein S18 acetylase RimI-like enzyme